MAEQPHDNDRLTITGIDPGKATGWSTVVVDRKLKQIIEEKNQILNMQELSNMLDMMVQGRICQTLVCEDFIIYSRYSKKLAGEPVWASEAIGLIRGAVLRSNGRLKLVMQTADKNKLRVTQCGKKLPKDHAKSHDIM